MTRWGTPSRTAPQAAITSDYNLCRLAQVAAPALVLGVCTLLMGWPARPAPAFAVRWTACISYRLVGRIHLCRRPTGPPTAGGLGYPPGWGSMSLTARSLAAARTLTLFALVDVQNPVDGLHWNRVAGCEQPLCWAVKPATSICSDLHTNLNDMCAVVPHS